MEWGQGVVEKEVCISLHPQCRSVLKYISVLQADSQLGPPSTNPVLIISVISPPLSVDSRIKEAGALGVRCEEMDRIGPIWGCLLE